MLLFAKIAGVEGPPTRSGPNVQGSPYSILHRVSTGELTVQVHSNHTENPQPLGAGLLAAQHPNSTAMHMLAAHQIVPSFPTLETKQPQVVMSKASEGGGVMKKEEEQNFCSSPFIKKGKIKVT